MNAGYSILMYKPDCYCEMHAHALSLRLFRLQIMHSQFAIERTILQYTVPSTTYC